MTKQQASTLKDKQETLQSTILELIIHCRFFLLSVFLRKIISHILELYIYICLEVVNLLLPSVCMLRRPKPPISCRFRLTIFIHATRPPADLAIS